MAQQRRDLETIKKIIIHCSDSDNPFHDNVETIRAWHKDFGFDDIGYHYVITKQYILPSAGRSLETVGAHCLGENKDSIGICVTGKRRFTPEQFAKTAILCEDLAKKLRWPTLIDRIFAHNHFNKSKTCPNFDIAEITYMLQYPE